MTDGTPLRTLDEDDLLARILPLFGGSSGCAPFRRRRRRAAHDRPDGRHDRHRGAGRDWLDAWSSGADIGHKVIASNLADVAAMGGTPTGVLVTLVADPGLSLEWVSTTHQGWAWPAPRPGWPCSVATCRRLHPASSWSR